MAAPERPRRASSAPQRPPGACAVSRPTLSALWCGQPLPPTANSAPCPGSACAFAARAAGGVHSGDSVRAPCRVLAAIAVVLASMRYQPPLQHAGAGLGGQTAPPARLQAPVVPCRAGGRTALLGAFLPAHALARLCWHTQTMWNLQRRPLRGVGGVLGLLRAIMRSKSGTRRQIVPSSSR